MTEPTCAFDQRAAALPGEARVLYKDPHKGFKARKAAYRADFYEKHGREPFALTDEDYTPVRFFQEVWGEYVQTRLLTSKYLEDKDPALYQALAHYIRGARQGRPGRDKSISFESIGVTTERDVMDRIVHARSRAAFEHLP
jgi:hypothetical protein